MEPITRRKFMKAAGLGAVAAASGPALAQDQPRPARSQAELLIDVVRARFGQHLSEAQLKSIQQRLSRQLATADQMKRTQLANGDEPAFVFVPEE